MLLGRTEIEHPELFPPNTAANQGCREQKVVPVVLLAMNPGRGASGRQILSVKTMHRATGADAKHPVQKKTSIGCACCRYRKFGDSFLNPEVGRNDFFDPATRDIFIIFFDPDLFFDPAPL